MVKSSCSKDDARRAYIGLVSQITAPGPFCVMLCTFAQRKAAAQRVLAKRALPILERHIRVIVIANLGVGEDVQIVEPAATTAPSKTTKELASSEHVMGVVHAAAITNSKEHQNCHMFHSLPPMLDLQLLGTTSAGT